MKLKKLLIYLAYIDIKRSGDYKQTYFYLCPDEIRQKNMSMIRNLSGIFSMLCIFVVLATTFFFNVPEIRNVYAILFIVEVIFLALSAWLTKNPCGARLCTIINAVYMAHILLFGSYIGTILSPDEGASIYLVALMLAPMLFIIPPCITFPIAAAVSVCTVIMSYLVKDAFFFRIDALNCAGVFFLSMLVGWLVLKVKVDESYARNQVDELNDKLVHMSVTDQLTGLPNHRSFQDTYYTMFEASRQVGALLGVVILDIDQFKAYNDNYGHVAGDKCLAAIGGAFASLEYDNLFVCRFGGEEFLILLQNTNSQRAEEIADAFRRSVEALNMPHAYATTAKNVTVSAGMYVGRPGPEDMPMSFVDKADRAMYQSKADGGNKLTSFADLGLSQKIEGSVDAYSTLSSRGRQVMRKKILVVDDNELNRLMLRKILSGKYSVLEAENGSVALELLGKMSDSVSAVLLDLMMPVMDGYEFLSLIKANTLLSRIPIIVSTSDSNIDAEIKSLSLGANDVILKPYKAEIILQRLQNLIALNETSAIVSDVEKDATTGVFGKEFFCKRAEALIQADAELKFDIICCDIERFKLVNELFGQKTGDKLLRHVGNVLSELVKDNGICGRVGSDRFACLVRHQGDYTEEYFQKLIEQINSFPISIQIKTSFGIYHVDDRALGVSTMCDRALIACISVKGKYDVSFAVYDSEFMQKLLNEQIVLDSMSTAIREKQFLVYYQPEFDLKTGRAVGAEALVRWLHPEKGFLSPDTFIPLFEKNGFITDLDAFVWETACEDLSQWIKNGGSPLPVSVNVSRADIYNPELPDILSGLTAKYHISPELLHLEITETAYTENSQQLIEMVSSLKALGFYVEMDDFGSGYSSLNMISRLPINALKLDIGFIQDELAGSKKSGILQFIIQLAGNLGLPVVAEGIETEAQASVLKEMGCEFAQGFYFSKPLPREEFEAFLKADAAKPL